MKKVLALLMSGLMLLSFAACSKDTAATSGYGIADEYLNNMEYSTYQDIFYNDTGAKYANKSYKKEGIFSVIHDSFKGTDRYYVWGFNDNTHCCDWQWELCLTDTSDLPKNGSLVEFEGTFKADEKALDGYWFVDNKITVKIEYTGSDVDYDLTTLSATLTRVQLINMLNYPDEYVGKTIKLIARVMGTESIQHPYYDDAWVLPVKTSKALPAIGKWIVATGTLSGSTAENCVFNITEFAEVSA